MSTEPTDSTGPTGPPGPTGVGARTEERLRGLDEAPVDDHVAVYDAVHRDLADVLSGTEPAW